MPPNILWIVLEDVSPRLGCYGDELANTPRIDSLAADGRRYDRMFSTTGVCAPSRASLVTGMMPQRLGAQHMRTETHDVEGLVPSYDCVPPHYVTAVSELLRKAGYYCTLDIKTDYQFGEPLTMWDHHGDGAGWWDPARQDSQPFFAMMTNAVTHESGMWPPSEDDSHREGGMVTEPVTDPDAVTVPPYLCDTSTTRRAIARQYDNIATLDGWVGQLLDRLEADGLYEETAVFLVGDHGEGLPRKKRWPTDGGTHVPLIVRWPGQLAGGSSDRLVSGVDLAPTTLTIAEVPPPPYVDGASFLGPDARDRAYVISTRDRVDESYDMVRSVRDRRYRYVRHYYADRPYVQHIPYRDRHPAMQDLLEAHARGALSGPDVQWVSADSRPPEALYDLEQDPHETVNLVDEEAYADVLTRLRSALDDRRSDIEGGSLGDESEQAMRDRIWPDGERPKTSAPIVVVRGPGGTQDQVASGQSIDGPVTIGLYCSTQGASLTWTAGTKDSRWRVYDGPIRVSSGTTVPVRARAVRYGFAASPAVECELQVV